MTGFNLPPGCSDSDIPGNRPEDIAWESFHERIDHDTDQIGVDVSDAYFIWEAGLEVYKRACAYAQERLKQLRYTQEDE